MEMILVVILSVACGLILASFCSYPDERTYQEKFQDEKAEKLETYVAEFQKAWDTRYK